MLKGRRSNGKTFPRCTKVDSGVCNAERGRISHRFFNNYVDKSTPCYYLNVASRGASFMWG
jgi:hypothetical protein